MCFNAIPSPGLAPPQPPLPEVLLCACGEPLELEIERSAGHCEECRFRASILRGSPVYVPEHAFLNHFLHTIERSAS